MRFLAGGSSFAHTAMTSYRNSSNMLVPLHSDGLTPYDFSGDIAIHLNSDAECLGFWIDCGNVGHNLDDITCGQAMQFACEGRCYPDGKVQALYKFLVCSRYLTVLYMLYTRPFLLISKETFEF